MAPLWFFYERADRMRKARIKKTEVISPIQTNMDHPLKEKSVDSEKLCVLKFSHSGWCRELNRSYFKGFYRPKNMLEYSALLQYAEGNHDRR